ncbi:MAG: DUF4338 domain-containing protein [Dehalococcoidia bacterium]|nr:MAG: DUF4338 domain-containing protein [Dehalococcoidia bacterium]
MTTLTLPTANQEKVFSVASEESLFPFRQTPVIKEDMPLEERVPLLLVRDLLRLGWRIKSNSNKSLELVPPSNYEKNVVKAAMAYSRNEIIDRNNIWISSHLDLARSNLAPGNDVLKSEIYPRIEVCETQNQHDIFRIFRYSWSSPSSDYVGRRIRLLIRDDGVKGSPIIGIAALGSSIIHIHDRDKWIGWDTKTRTNRIIYMMDAYVVGAMPPYNYLLGGKLVSYILASNELRAIYKNKYADAKTVIKNRKASDLVLLVTTSLYGQNSSQYNRLRYGESLLYKPIGTTSGYGSLHISNETFNTMLQLAEENGCNISNRFGGGPNWRMRVIRSACDVLSLNSDVILKHSFQRGLFAVRLALNWRAFLKGESQTPIYRNIPFNRLVIHWRDRWFNMRKQNELVIQKVREFSPEQFAIEKPPN